MGWMEAVSGVSLEAQAVCPPFGGAERRMCARALLLLPGLQKWQLGFLVLLYIVHNLSQLPIPTITFSLL